MKTVTGLTKYLQVGMEVVCVGCAYLECEDEKKESPFFILLGTD